MLLALLLLPLCSFIPSIKGHGRLIDPPSRASAWRYGFNTPHNYNDHELYCGGFTRQWVKNGGKCGVCGDAWDSKTPRPHEFGGTYGEAVIVRKYNAGAIINIRIELTANHHGYFEFGICPDYKSTSQECLDKNILKLMKPQEGVEHKNFRYFPKDGNKVYEIKYRLPKKKCEHCVLQWRYIAGNNWGSCSNGTGAVGCGPQEEFRACADITIAGKGDTLLPDVATPSTTTSISSTTRPPFDLPPTPEESYSPVSALIITLISFLVVCLILFLLYFHFYQVGRQFKNWVKGSPKKSGGKSQNLKLPPLPPLPPPRIRKPGPPRVIQKDRNVENV